MVAHRVTRSSRTWTSVPGVELQDVDGSDGEQQRSVGGDARVLAVYLRMHDLWAFGGVAEDHHADAERAVLVGLDGRRVLTEALERHVHHLARREPGATDRGHPAGRRDA